MNSKNWNDRADKDLFFTILSVKNIGVISGSEWVTIGNYMRGLGYGFTNEGCRQHFQGLRRAQNKADTTNGVIAETSRKVDPTLNPITRRPGPGRGRPRKSTGGQGGEGEPEGTNSEGLPSPVPAGGPDQPLQPTNGPPPHTHTQQFQQHQLGQHPQPFQHHPGQHPGHHHGHHLGQQQHWPSPQASQFQHAHPGQQQQQQPLQQQPLQQQPLQQQPLQQHSPTQTPQPLQSHPAQQHSIQQHLSPQTIIRPVAPPDQDVTAPGIPTPETGTGPTAPEPLPLQEENGDEDEEEEENDGHDADQRPVKRQRTNDDDIAQDPALDDDPVLALANAHNGGTPADAYGPDFNYAEA